MSLVRQGVCEFVAMSPVGTRELGLKFWHGKFFGQLSHLQIQALDVGQGKFDVGKSVSAFASWTIGLFAYLLPYCSAIISTRHGEKYYVIGA